MRGRIAVQHQGLLAVDHPGGAVLPRGGLHVVQMITRLFLAVRERQPGGAVNHAADQRVPAAAQEAAAENDAGQIWLQHQPAPERFHHDHGLDRAAAAAALGLGKRQTEQAEFGEGGPQRGTEPVRLARDGGAVGEVAVMVGNQALDAVLQQALLVGEIEVHDVLTIPEWLWR